MAHSGASCSLASFGAMRRRFPLQVCADVSASAAHHALRRHHRRCASSNSVWARRAEHCLTCASSGPLRPVGRPRLPDRASAGHSSRSSTQVPIAQYPPRCRLRLHRKACPSMPRPHHSAAPHRKPSHSRAMRSDAVEDTRQRLRLCAAPARSVRKRLGLAVRLITPPPPASAHPSSARRAHGAARHELGCSS